MPRAWRTFEEGRTYHVYNRVGGRLMPLNDEDLVKAFVGLFRKVMTIDGPAIKKSSVAGNPQSLPSKMFCCFMGSEGDWRYGDTALHLLAWMYRSGATKGPGGFHGGDLAGLPRKNTCGGKVTHSSTNRGEAQRDGGHGSAQTSGCRSRVAILG